MSARNDKGRQPRKRKASVAEPQYLVVGKVLRAHGIRGELRLEIHSDHPGHLGEVHTIYLGIAHRPHQLKSFRLHKGVILIAIDGYDDRDKAESLRGEVVSVRFDDAVPLRQGEYYHHQIIGLNVVTDEGEELGSVAEIIRTGANDVYVVRGQGGELLLPAIQSVIRKIEPLRMIVHLLPGLR